MSLVVNDAEKRITNPYGNGHNGVDIGWRSNEAENEVWANSAGEVVEVQDGLGNIPNATGVKSWGNYVYIKHPNGMYTRYAHLKSGIHVKVGDKVNALTSLGVIGNSGNANGRHLHFEVSERYDSRYRIDPTPYLTKPVYDDEVVEVPQPTPVPPTPTPQPTTYKVGDEVIVNGVLTADSYGGGAHTKNYNNQKAKIIIIKNDGRPRPYALNMNNNMNGVTGWGSKDQIRK